MPSYFSDSDRTRFEHGALCRCLHFISLLESSDAESICSIFWGGLLESPFVIFFVLDVGCSAATCREVGSLMYANFDSANMLLVLDD